MGVGFVNELVWLIVFRVEKETEDPGVRRYSTSEKRKRRRQYPCRMKAKRWDKS